MKYNTHIIILLFPLHYISTLEGKQTRSLMHSKHSNDAVGVVMLFLAGDIITIHRNNSSPLKPQTRFHSVKGNWESLLFSYTNFNI